jgi:aspartyl-tRNA(Asn)/glutamyl-tRNA(Gln) amidotransferase subunit B
MGDILASLNRDELDIAQCPVTPAQLAKLLARISDGTISNKIARDVFQAMWVGENNGDADAIIEAKGLKQISDTGAIGVMIVEEYRSGKQKAFNSLVGQVMKAAKGKANPAQVNALLKEKLG